MARLAGKVAFITGAATGIGRAPAAFGAHQMVTHLVCVPARSGSRPPQTGTGLLQ